MKRIYAPTYSKWAIEPDGKTLVGYEYKGYNIKIVDYAGSRNSMYGSTHRWYNVTLKSGEQWSSDRLYDIKRYIEEEIDKDNEEMNK